MNKPIYGHVPGALPPPPLLPDGIRLEEEVPMSEEKNKGRDWAKGYPRGTKKADVIAGVVAPPSEAPPPPRKKPGRPPTQRPPPPHDASRCIGCQKELSPLSLAMIGELLRLARDRLADAGGDARTDLLYLAARVDGCCSVSCWSHNVAPDALVQALFDR